MNPIHLFLLILVANATPLLAGLILPRHWQLALDGGKTCRDGRPLFGPAKTWPGIATALLCTTLLGLLLEESPLLAVLIALYAMLGDLLSSFIKRRLKLGSSQPAPGLDQLPEVLLPLIFIASLESMPVLHFIAIVTAFLLLDLLLSHLLYRLSLRPHPL